MPARGGRVPDRTTQFEKAVRDCRRRPVLVLELLRFIWAQRRWWLLPVIISVLLAGSIIALGGSGGALLIYALF